MRRIVLFMATNLAIIFTLTVILTILGIDRYGGLQGQLIFCLVWGMGGSFISLQMSRFIAKQAMGVKLVDGRTGHADIDWVYGTIRQLTDRAGLPMPEVGIYESPEVNAFATGPSRSRSLVAVSSGLLRAMSRDEVEGVLAHEVSHIQNGDMVTMTLIQGVVNAFVMFFARVIASLIRSAVDERMSGVVYFMTVIVLQIVLGVFGMMVVAWFSRAREFRADAGAATLAGRGKMVAALQRLQQNTRMIEGDHPALATMKISGTRSWMAVLSTHPPLEARIAALQLAR
ncbi:MAG: protease HtpX [Acidobacteriota bacterium]|nr:protease HtpX [Acidobacteriota bacterium]